ncbi:MAG TPA: ERAP1-like C-terminal domain-containing protein, partial [Pyrinomonadaceae bacterium]|nr:ERAP1-like C-terminal domain-containing protein [Pyrinomonadaceae bacterium]
DDLWLKEGFAEFMAYKTLEKVLPEYNAWKAFYERNKPLAYLTDSTRGTTPIYQEIPNLSAAKSAYGNIVYRKAPAFLKQAEFYFGEDRFQTAVRAFLKKHEFANAEWTDLVTEFAEIETAELKTRDYYQKIFTVEERKAAELSTKNETNGWANSWVKKRGVFKFHLQIEPFGDDEVKGGDVIEPKYRTDFPENSNVILLSKFKILIIYKDGTRKVESLETLPNESPNPGALATKEIAAIIPNYQDYGYGIFLLDPKSRDYVLKNIQNEKDAFLRSMMWGALWDSVREAELNPKDYVALAIKNISAETDELTIQTILGRVGTAMNYYLSETEAKQLAPQLEKVLLEKITNAETAGQRITFYRAFLNVASSADARQKLKDVLNGKFEIRDLKLKTKDKFDIVTKLLILNDPDAPKLLDDLRKIETSDEAKRYAYAAGAGFPTKEMKQSYFNDFLNNKEISESWIESASTSFNSTRHADLTLPYLEKALAELPKLKQNRKIFFVNNWLSAFIGGQKSEQALAIVNKFLADNSNLDRDLRLKILEVGDNLERAVKIRKQFADKQN